MSNTNLNDETMEEQQLPTSNFGFSATKIENLGSAEYTLAGVGMDCSGSTASFRAEMENVLKEVVKTMRKSPRADNLMLRSVVFADNLEEIHGFKLLENINEDDYNGVLDQNNLPSGLGVCTALRDAIENGASSITTYAEQLRQSNFDANAILIIITDGLDNASKTSPAKVKKAFEQAVQSEALESIVTILVGINVQDYGAKQALATLAQEAGFTQYVDAGDASANNLAKLAQFVSKSISSQSQSLGKGAASQSLSF